MNQTPTSAKNKGSGRSYSAAQITSKYGLFLILAIFIGLGLLYDFTVPLFEKPDELKHFAVIQYIQTRHTLPLVQAGVYKPYDQEGTQPPLYHILAAAATSWLNLTAFEEPPRNPHYVDDRSFVWRERGNNNLYLHPPAENLSSDSVIIAARLTRWLSLLAGAATVALTYFLAKVTFSANSQWQTANSKPHTPVSLGTGVRASAPHPASQFTHHTSQFIIHNSQLFSLFAAALVAFIPQFLHVNSGITNDSLAATLAAADLLLLALVIKNGASTRYTIFLGLTLGLGAITKLSLLYMIPLAGLVYLLDYFRYRSLSRLFKAGAILGGLILLLSGWWFWLNWQRYGDITALTAHLLYRGGALNPTPTLAQIWQTELTGLELSFWAAFGAGQILIEPWLYVILRSIKYIVVLGFIIGVWRLIKGAGGRGQESGNHYSQFTIRNTQRARCSLFAILLLLFLWTLIIFVALLRWMQITPASWGRLLYPALPSLSVLTIWSIAQFWIYDLRRQSPKQNGKGFTNYVLRITFYVLAFLPWIILIFLFTLSLVSPFRYTHTAYAKTPLIAQSQIPPNIQSLDLTYNDDLRLLGYRIEKDAVHPGDWLPVTLYWQAIRPIDQNYSAFVHLLDPQGQAIAQANSYPDGGNWPTSMLPPGQVLPDTHYIFVPPDANTPQATRLAIGIFEFDDPQRTAKPAINTAGEQVEPIFDGPPLVPTQWPVLSPGQPLAANFANQIQLIGYDSVYQNIKPGDVLPLTLYWETLQPPGQNLNLFIHLIDPATGEQIAGFDAPPDFPTGYWQPGNTIIDSRSLPIPADLPPGQYNLRIGWYNLTDFARLPLVEAADGDALQLFALLVENP